jgi:predicted nucleotidyltransferase
LKRKTAIKKLDRILERVENWNQNFSKYTTINDIFLLGSLARQEDSVGDIDLCVNTEVRKNIKIEADEYIEWRRKNLEYFNQYWYYWRFVNDDPIRYIMDRDGRIEVLAWDQLGPIALTCDPYVRIIENGKRKFENAEQSLQNARSLDMETAKKIIFEHNLPEKQLKNDFFWNSYRNTLMEYPLDIRLMILKRDGYTESDLNI